MTNYVLRPGIHLLYGGREHIIEQRLPDNSFRLKDLATSQCTAVANESLVDGVFEGQVELLGPGREYVRVKDHKEKTRVSDLTALSNDDPRKKAAKRRLAYVEGMEDRGQVKFTKEFLQPVIEKVGTVLGEMSHDAFKRHTKAEQAELKKAGVRVQPSPASLFRWYTDYEKAGGDIRALVPAFKSQGNFTRKISDDEEKTEAVLGLIKYVIDEEYMTEEHPSVQECWESLVALIAKENRRREEEEGDKLPRPHIVTLYRIINKIPKYERDLARHGKRVADNNHRANKQGPRPTRPLERVEADDTKLDLFVIDDQTMMPLGRPWLIALIDVYTKMILGFYLSFVPPSYLSVMQCLLHAIRPKTYVRDKYPDIRHTWDTYGMPRLLVVDNAKHWICADFDEACQQLDIETQYCPVRHPWYKTSIERWLGTKNRTLHALPGTTFSNIFEREDYNPRKHAVVSLKLLEKIIHKWIIDIYQRRKHRGIKDVPVRLWTIGTEKFPPALPPSAAELEVLLGHIEWRVISNSGIEMFCLFYNSDRLAPIKSALKKGQKVKVKYDPMDISMVYVYDEHNGRYIAVPAVDQEYTKGLTLWQHEVIKKHASSLADEYVDIEELCEAKASIKEEVRKAAKILRKHGTNVRLGRWLEDEKAGEHRSSEGDSGTAGGERKAQSKKGEPVRAAAADGNPARGISDFGDASEPSSSGRVEPSERVPGVAAQTHSDSAKTKPSGAQKRGASGSGVRGKSAGKTSPKQEQSKPARRPERSRARSGRKRDESAWGFDFTQPK